MYIILRFISLYIISSNIVYAAEQPCGSLVKIQPWQLSLNDKLRMSCERTIPTGGIPQAIIAHIPTKKIIVASPLPGGTETNYRMETFDDSWRVGRQDLTIQYYLSTLALDDHQNPIILQVFFDRVSLHSRDDCCVLRVKHTGCILGAATMTPGAHVIALSAYNPELNKQYIGLCNTVDRTIKTITVDASPPCGYIFEGTKSADGLSVSQSPIYPRIAELAVSADGLSIAWSTDRGDLKVLHTAKPKSERTLVTMAGKEFHHLAWSPTKKILACGLYYRTSDIPIHSLLLISAAKGKILAQSIMEYPVTACSFIDKDTLAVGTANRELHIYALHLDLKISPSILEMLTPAAKLLCIHTTQCRDAYRVNEFEKDCYERLPKTLQQPWLFNLPTAT